MAINTKTYLSKSNTIVEQCVSNVGLNPILELNYGNGISRGLIYFDHTKIKNLVEDKTYSDLSKLKHVLKMTNTSSIRTQRINNCTYDLLRDKDKLRAISFDIILFLIPKEWDNGRGFDFREDLYDTDKRGYSKQGSNWYNYQSYKKWDEAGVYTTEHLSRELDLYTSKEGNQSKIIIGKQHFDYGNENLCIDITDTVNKFITGELENYGLGIAFSPLYEWKETKLPQYVGFFTNNTHSFFEPYVETIYDEYISDDRNDFYLDKDNKLYFYASVGGQCTNLDELPTCTIEGSQKAVKQAGKGVYYIDINMSSEEYEDETMYYDVWGNIVYNGKQFKDVELSFVTHHGGNYFSFGLPTDNVSKDNKKFELEVRGINQKEEIQQGDIRKVIIDCRIPYTVNQQYSVNGIMYRLYVKEGDREIDVIDYTNAERTYNQNYFLINTSDLLPAKYYIDIKVKYDREEIITNGILEFLIPNNITDERK